MPIHDWSRVEAGIFHDFHHAWIEEIKRALNGGLLPDDYYALAEQHAAGFGPDVLKLQGNHADPADADAPPPSSSSGGGLLLAAPPIPLSAETDLEFYRRKQKVVAVRHVSGDSIIAMVEVVSPGNKSGRNALRAFVDKAVDLVSKKIHLLILDLHPPGRHDRRGIHSAIWEDMTDEPFASPADKLLTLVAYEAANSIRAYVKSVAVGDVLADMPLFLQPGGHILVPLERTYQAAFAAVPRRWRRVLETNGA